MREMKHALADSEPELPTADFRVVAADWVLDGEQCNWSPRTIEARQMTVDRLQWFLDTRGHTVITHRVLRAFFAHAARGHLEPGGRWGKETNTTPLRPATLDLFWRNLATLFTWLVAEGDLTASPMARVARPHVPKDQIRPFTTAQVQALLDAAGRTYYPTRDQALLWLLYDTGARASEVCCLKLLDVDLAATVRSIRVRGKGNKTRTLPIGRRATRALWKHIRAERPAADDWLFVGQRGVRTDEPLCSRSLTALIHRLGEDAGIKGVRCSAHTFRHSFAISALQQGMDIFTLQSMLGHESLEMVKRYLAISQANVAEVHRRTSPGDRLGRR